MYETQTNNGFRLNNRFNVVLARVMQVRWVFVRWLVLKSFIFV
jgi:hypothetical protein